jgi:hypothetical protein
MKSIASFGAAALLFSSAQAHISMNSPTPFSPKPDTSPMSAGGDNFPCKKSGSGLSVNTVTKATVGQPIELTFSGSADHSGGSCQVSLSKDDVSALSPNSQFKVIYSIMGGCPGLNGAENKYSVPIPTEVPSGSYTMAWTWFNKVGNREMYMNCAPLTVSGGSATDSQFSSLPDMAVYNIASKNDCKTIETADVQFPNPGKYVLTGSGFKPSPPTGSCATGGSGTPLAPGTSTGGGSVAAGGSGSSGSSGSSNTGNSGASSPSGFDDGQYHPNGVKPSASIKASPDAAPTTMSTAAAPRPAMSTGASVPASSPPKPANGSDASGGFIGKNPSPPPAAAAPSGSASASAPAPAAVQACATDGAVVCSPDGTQFGLCNFGKVQFMAVAEGTKCVNGAIAGRRARKVRSFF